MKELLERIRSLEAAWLGAAAAVAGAGVAIFKGHRIVAGLVGGGAVLAFALWRQGHSCCADCAGKAAATGAAAASSAAPDAAPSFDASFDSLYTSGGAQTSAASSWSTSCKGCA